MDEELIEFPIETFTTKVETLVTEHKLSYMEAICQFCEDNNIDDPGSIKSKIPSNIIEKVTAEANERNLLKKQYTEESLASFFDE